MRPIYKKGREPRVAKFDSTPKIIKATEDQIEAAKTAMILGEIDLAKEIIADTELEIIFLNDGHSITNSNFIYTYKTIVDSTEFLFTAFVGYEVWVLRRKYITVNCSACNSTTFTINTTEWT